MLENFSSLAFDLRGHYFSRDAERCLTESAYEGVQRKTREVWDKGNFRIAARIRHQVHLSAAELKDFWFVYLRMRRDIFHDRVPTE